MYIVIYNVIQILNVQSEANSAELDQMSHSVAFHLAQRCLRMSHKMDARLI